MVQFEPDAAKLLQEVEANLRRLYRGADEMPYHNIGHPQDVRDHARKLVERCKKAGISVEELVVELGALLHDALSDVDPKLFGHDSSESLAAFVSKNLLINLGVPLETAEKVSQGIKATNALVNPQTVEEKILRAADLREMSASYNEFRANSLKLKHEAELRRGVTIDLWSSTVSQCKYLQLYLWRMIELTPDALDSDGRSVWHTIAMRNILGLAEESSASRDRTVRVIVTEIGEDGKIMVPESAPKEDICFIALSPKEELREAALKNLRALQQHAGADPTYGFILPGTAETIPLPEQSVDEIMIQATAGNLAELARVLKRKGEVN